MRLSIVICTHNRSELLCRCLNLLNMCTRPDAEIGILVIANACTDETHRILDDYGRSGTSGDHIPLRWEAEPAPGKSHALNHAIKLLDMPVAVFMDDDQLAEKSFLVGICNALNEYPDASILCGRLLPKWDGKEPEWLHDGYPYRIYPPPVAGYEMGNAPRQLSTSDILPPGGDLIVKRDVFSRIGSFSTDLGPRGHDLLGGEDAEFLSRALKSGESVIYVPDIIQFHIVDDVHTMFTYLLRKSYQRSRSVTRISSHTGGSIPNYMWKKLMIYGLKAIFSLSWPRTRFYSVRAAAALGEIRGLSEAHRFKQH